MKYIHRYHDFDSFIEEYDDEQKYIEPWVSFCDEAVVLEFVITCNCDHDPLYFYGASFDEEVEEGIYHWNAFRLPGGSEPGYTYYTRSRNPRVGDPVYGSVEGMGRDEPLGCVESITKMYDNVTYNKKSNWIRVEYSAGSSNAYVSIIEWGSGFDNSENSEYYVYDDNAGEETTYQGVNLYWNHYYDLYIDDTPCGIYYFIESDGNGGWEIGSGVMYC